MKLNILIATHNEKVANVPSIFLPEREDVSYIVSYQYSDEQKLSYIPDGLKREDVVFLPMRDLGLCKNRNNALSYAD